MGDEINKVQSQIIPFSNKHVEVKRDGEHGAFTYIFDRSKHAKTLAANLATLRKHEILDDVILIAKDEKKFKFHSVLLAVCSSVFRQVFAGTSARFFQGELSLDVDSAILHLLQKYVYRESGAAGYTGKWNDLVDFAAEYGFNGFTTGFSEPEELMQELQSMWLNHELTYTVVKVSGADFPCHDCVLAACSPLVFKQFEDDPLSKLMGRVVTIKGVQDSALKAILNFVYTANLTLNDKNVGGVMEASSHLKFPSISWACVDYIIFHLKADNALGCLEFARKGYILSKNDFYVYLAKRAREFIVQTFPEIIKHDEFLTIPNEDEILDYMRETNQKKMDYNSLLTSLMDWLKHAESERWETYARLVSGACRLLDTSGFAHVLKKIQHVDNVK